MGCLTSKAQTLMANEGGAYSTSYLSTVAVIIDVSHVISFERW